MKFQRAIPNSDYRALRLLSVGGKWELGFSPYLRGMRLRMGQTGRPPRVMDFCLGTDTAIFLRVLAEILRWLGDVDEAANAEDVDAVFPWAGRRPDLRADLAGALAERRESQVERSLT